MHNDSMRAIDGDVDRKRADVFVEFGRQVKRRVGKPAVDIHRLTFLDNLPGTLEAERRWQGFCIDAGDALRAEYNAKNELDSRPVEFDPAPARLPNRTEREKMNRLHQEWKEAVIPFVTAVLDKVAGGQKTLSFHELSALAQSTLGVRTAPSPNKRHHPMKTDDPTPTLNVYFGAHLGDSHGHGLTFNLDPKLAKLAAAEAAPGLEQGNVYTGVAALHYDALLDWDKGYAEQTPAVKKLLTASGIKRDYDDNHAHPEKLSLPAWTRDAKKTGRTIWGFVSERIDAQKFAALKQEQTELTNKINTAPRRDVTAADKDRLAAIREEIAQGTASVRREARNRAAVELAKIGVPGIIYTDHFASEQLDRRTLTIFDPLTVAVTHRNGVELATSKEKSDALLFICAKCEVNADLSSVVNVEDYLPFTAANLVKEKGIEPTN